MGFGKGSVAPLPEAPVASKAQLEQKDKEIASLKKQLEQKDKELAAKDKELAAKDKEIAALKAAKPSPAAKETGASDEQEPNDGTKQEPSGQEKPQAEHDAEMPQILREFQTLAKQDDIRPVLAELKLLDDKVVASPSNEDERSRLASQLKNAGVKIKAAIEARLDEPGIAACCDVVITEGLDFFVETYNTIFKTIENSEEDAKSYAAHAERLSRCAETGGSAPEHSKEGHVAWLLQHGAKAKAMQRYEDISVLHTSAIRAMPAFQATLKKVQAEVPDLASVKPGPIKGTPRILEKVLLRRDDEGNANCVADVVRALLEVPSMRLFNEVLQALAAMHEKGDITIVRVKDRIKAPMGGWRDVMVNFYVTSSDDRHVCEIQIAHQKMLTARKGLDGHAIYNRVRNASELREKLGIDGEEGRAERVVGLLGEPRTAGELVQMWQRLERSGDVSALPDAARARAQGSGNGDETKAVIGLPPGITCAHVLAFVSAPALTS